MEQHSSTAAAAASAGAAMAAPVNHHTKQYVFVDEYNRHKRLKVMRACDGCRKRKIRCDGALQNGPWPCGACIRLKLKCVPPTLDQDDESQSVEPSSGQHQFSFQNTGPYSTATTTNTSCSSTTATGPPPTATNTAATATGKPMSGSAQSQAVHDWATGIPSAMTSAASAPIPVPVSVGGMSQGYNLNAYNTHQQQQQQDFSQSQLGPRLDAAYVGDEYFASAQFQQQARPVPGITRSHTNASVSSGGEPQDMYESARELTEQMGSLSIDITSKASYITDAKKGLVDEPAPEESDVILPPSVHTDPTPRIPPEMMPSEERALDYFGYFFDHIHPYIPVLNKATFYEQWRTARHQISPLILEGIFACAAQYLDQPIDVKKWLALASRHEESYKDVPRLSTIQAIIILSKAREFVPRKGYYYRSWMSIKYMTTMSFDLGLHEHYDQHRSGGEACTLSKADCTVRTRIWQTLFILEILVGASQGRTDFAVELESVELTVPPTSPELDPYEYAVSRRYTFLTQDVRNIKQTNRLWQTMRRFKKDWALDPAFVRHNEDLPTWLKHLPADFQLHYPQDGSPPYLGGDHFVAYVHVYHHLVVIMHHRPQLQTMLEQGNPAFREHLDICLQSASYMCRAQEALWRDFGTHGLQFMLRGSNFTIYCVLTCAMLHLAAVTSPESHFYIQARTYFPRQMRILEYCLPSSPPEMQVQINALRDAFSADTSKPFELKSSLGLRSPSMDSHPTPPSTNSGPISVPTVHGTPGWSSVADTTISRHLTPPTEYGSTYSGVANPVMASQVSLSYEPASYDITANATYAPNSLHNVSSAQQIGYSLEPVISPEQQPPVWDPSGIFNQWNTAFGGSAPPPQQTPPDPRTMQAAAMISRTPQSMYGTQQTSPGNEAVPPTPVPTMPTVTPVMWQDAFTTAYVSGQGQKRYRETSVDHSAYAPYSSSKRRG